MRSGRSFIEVQKQRNHRKTSLSRHHSIEQVAWSSVAENGVHFITTIGKA